MFVEYGSEMRMMILRSRHAGTDRLYQSLRRDVIYTNNNDQKISTTKCNTSIYSSLIATSSHPSINGPLNWRAIHALTPRDPCAIIPTGPGKMKRWEMVRVSHLSISFDDYPALQSKHHNIPVRTLKIITVFSFPIRLPAAILGRIIGILANLAVTHSNLSPIAWINRIRFLHTFAYHSVSPDSSSNFVCCIPSASIVCAHHCLCRQLCDITVGGGCLKV